MNTLVVDIGGTNVKIWRTGESDRIKIESGKDLTPEEALKQFREQQGGYAFDRVSIGYPGEVVHGRPVKEPYNLGPGWVDFDYARAFGTPVRIMNDACMQALGSYEGGKMLYLGLGTSIGTVFISDGRIVPLALGHLLLSEGTTLEAALNRKALDNKGVKPWRKAAIAAAEMFQPAFLADYVTFGGGNAKKLEDLPPEFRRGSNHNAYFGGLRMWEDAKDADPRLNVFPTLQEA